MGAITTFIKQGIKTTASLFAKKSASTSAKDLALQGGRQIAKKEAEQLVKQGAIKTEAKNLATKVLSSKTASTTAKVGLLAGGVAGATALTGASGSYAYDKLKGSFSQTSEQAQRAKDIELFKAELSAESDYNKLLNEQRQKDLEYYKDYTKVMSKDNGDVMTFDEFTKWLNDQEAQNKTDMDTILGTNGAAKTDNKKWIYLIAGIGALGAGYLIYKKGKKAKK